MGMPGVWEIIIIAVVGLIIFVIPVAILLVILFVFKSQSRPGPVGSAASAQCPSCQMPVASNAVFCSACGKKLLTAETPPTTN